MIQSELCKFGAKVSGKLIPEPLQLIMAKRGVAEKVIGIIQD